MLKPLHISDHYSLFDIEKQEIKKNPHQSDHVFVVTGTTLTVNVLPSFVQIEETLTFNDPN